MDDDTATRGAAPATLDPVNADPRELMRVLLPEARTMYLRAWELLADANVPLERRRTARERVAAIADGHAAIVECLRGREASLSGDDLLNARHLATELERHVEALGRMATISPIGLADAATLRPEALGCGKRYRDPAREAAASGSGSRNVSATPTAKPREQRDRGRGSDRPFTDRGPKVSRDALGSSKHDSPLSKNLDDDTRAKLEAMLQGLDAEGDS